MKNTITVLVLVLSFNGLNAQTQSGGEWLVHAGGGLTFKFNSDLTMPAKESGRAGFGGNLGIDYTFFFSPYFGVSLGVEAAMYNNSVALSDFDAEQKTEIPPGLTGSFYLRTRYEGIAEHRYADHPRLFRRFPARPFGYAQSRF